MDRDIILRLRGMPFANSAIDFAFPNNILLEPAFQESNKIMQKYNWSEVKMKKRCGWLLFVPFVSFNFHFFEKVFANDGFYQGAGNTLVPVGNKSMRVISEVLDITPLDKPKCYAIVIPKASYDINGEVKEGANALIGNKVECSNKLDLNKFIAKWHAKAVYKVEALSDQMKTQIGFPVPQWSYSTSNSEGRVDLSVPSVVNFETFIDGKPIKQIDLKSVSLSEQAKDSNLKPAMVWNLDFSTGKQYELVTEYDFGVSYSSAMYGDREYPKEKILWFDPRPMAAVRFDGPSFPSESVVYYMQPIKLWQGGLPESISVKVKTFKNMPVTYLTPTNSGLACIDNEAVYFSWKNSFPEVDLHISYPVLNEHGKKMIYRKMNKQYQYNAWADLMGSLTIEPQEPGRFPKIVKTCELMNELKQSLPKKSHLSSWIENGIEKCVASCR